MRRLRSHPALRALVEETRLSPSDFVQPLFICAGTGVNQPVEPMPGVSRLSVDQLGAELEEILQAQIPAVLLFGIPAKKDETASGAYDAYGVVQRAIREIRRRAPELVIIADVCLCEYTSHGHCGIVRDGVVLNDETLAVLQKIAVSVAEAGAHLVAPSDMMDGRVSAIREALDRAGFGGTAIMAYSAKYCSAFYGPFREAAESAPQFGDRKAYQMAPPNLREALREVQLDIEEGADIVMVKPALAYLDVIAAVRTRFDVPVAAYNVSGEYAMVRAAGRLGWIDEQKVIFEILTAIKRAGADLIVTYHAKEVSAWIRQGIRPFI